MRQIPLIAAMLIIGSTHAEVRELEGDEMNTAYVTGISIAVAPDGASFADDDTDLREQSEQARSGIDTSATEINIEGTAGQPGNPALEDLIAGMSPNRQQRINQIIIDTDQGAQFQVDMDELSKRTEIEFNPIPQVDSVQDLVELFPSGTGYQFEFKPREF